MSKEEELKGVILVLAVALFLFLGIFLAKPILAYSLSSSGLANLTIFDDTDSENRYSGFQITFSANFTNESGSYLNSSQGNAFCGIRIKLNGVYASMVNMSFNTTNTLWNYTSGFTSKGLHQFLVNCTSDYGNITLNESFMVSNTVPSISLDHGNAYIDLDGNKFNNDYLFCTEDTLCIYNFSSNVTDPDTNDVLTFGYSASGNTTLTNFTINSTTGILRINLTTNVDSSPGLKQIELNSRDTESQTQSGFLRINITTLNDAPRFVNLNNQSLNSSSLFTYTLNIADEENNTPLSYNITFLSCSLAEWTTRDPSNCTLFSDSQYTTDALGGKIIINFTPTRNDVGTYMINFTVTDTSTLAPINASTSLVVNFSVNNVNLFPLLDSPCISNRSTIEDQGFSCTFNATDLDETRNLTFSSNVSWFLSNNATIVNASTNFVGNITIAFNPGDYFVGNWTINLSVTDTGSPPLMNSTLITFYVARKNDSVFVDPIPNVTVYTSNTNHLMYFNASDDDFFEPDKLTYNETLYFSSNDSAVTVVPYVYLSGTNKTTARITFDPSTFSNGNRTVNITVADKNNYSSWSRVFTIQTIGNTPPQWNESMNANFSLTENTLFFLNLSKNVTDSQDDPISFTNWTINVFTNSNFSMSTSGILNFTPSDFDIGEHTILINASDGVTPTTKTFNFTVFNINDNPSIQPFQTNVNLSTLSGSNLITGEDNYSELYLFVQDDDLKISSSYKSFYNEIIRVNLTMVSGPNANLIEFDSGSQFGLDKTKFSAVFTPSHTDIGNYSYMLNITDASNISRTLEFNLTITSVTHAPILSNVSAMFIRSIQETVVIDFNATDVEDVAEGDSASNITYRIENLTAGGDFLTIDPVTGIINVSLNVSMAGIWSFRVSANDSSDISDSKNFSLTVYGFPSILSPVSSSVFYFVENQSSTLQLNVNHTIGDELTYTLYLNGIERNSTTGFGNGSDFNWSFAPNFTDETTCTGIVNITINVSNSKLSNSTSWNVEINHSNAPLQAIASIGGSDKLVTGGASAVITLSDFFSDADMTDNCTASNNSVGFTLQKISNATDTISMNVVNWTESQDPFVNFSSSTSNNVNYSIQAYEFNDSTNLGNVTGNNFTVKLTIETVTVDTPSTSGGGGGGGGGSTPTPVISEKIVSLKILVPGPISVKKKDHIIIPLGVENTGQVPLKEIVLTAHVSKNGVQRNDIIATFDHSIIDILAPKQFENLTLIADINTQDSGLYEVLINATVKSPAYNDWAKVFIQVEPEDDLKERIIFTEEYIVGNPECNELLENINEAKILFNQSDFEGSRLKLEQAIEGCKRAIAQPPPSRSLMKIQANALSYASLASLGALLLGLGYYSFTRIRLRRNMNNYKERFNNNPGGINRRGENGYY